MSRIGNLPIDVPKGVTVQAEDKQIKVSGPHGELVQELSDSVSFSHADDQIIFKAKDDSRASRTLHGTMRSLVANMVKGVTEPYSKNLLIEGVGFRAAVKGSHIDLELGYSHPVSHAIPDGVTVKVSDNVKIEVVGADKQKVGQLAADIKSYYPVEPYKGKGVRILGEYVRRKEGKKSA